MVMSDCLPEAILPDDFRRKRASRNMMRETGRNESEQRPPNRHSPFFGQASPLAALTMLSRLLSAGGPAAARLGARGAAAACAAASTVSPRAAFSSSTSPPAPRDVAPALLARLADPSLLRHTASWVDGAPLASPATFTVTDPSTGAPLAHCSRAGAAEAGDAISAAAAAFPAWAARTAKDRAAVLGRWAAAITAAAPDLAELVSAEAGKTVGEARGEVASAAASVAWAAGEAVRVAGAVLPASEATKRALTLRQPVGVVGAITPWNFPASMVTRK